MRRHVLPAVLAIAYAVAVVIAAWRAPDKGFQAFLGRRIVHVERGALHEGEVIERIDGAPVASTLDYAFRVLGRAPGETVRIGTHEHDETIVLAASEPPWWSFVATLLAAVLLGAGIVARRARPDDAHARRFFRAAFVYAIVFVGALSWTKLIVHPVLAVGFLLALFAGPGVALDLALGLGTGGRRAQRVLMALSAGLAVVCGVALVRAVTDRSSDGALAWVVAASRRRSRCCPCTRSSGCGPSCARIVPRPARRRRSCGGWCSGTRSARSRSSPQCRSRSRGSTGS